ncbi:hypothetical protein OHA44_36885 [Streptomyces sp. NBC_00144]|uniref:hypothetical protein n=1 Tax=Streptomyces sp. NBC_00144 TaxID=2975665 RepID=UPI003251CC4E
MRDGQQQRGTRIEPLPRIPVAAGADRHRLQAHGGRPRSSAVLLLKAVHIDITADLAPPASVNNR